MCILMRLVRDRRYHTMAHIMRRQREVMELQALEIVDLRDEIAQLQEFDGEYEYLDINTD